MIKQRKSSKVMDMVEEELLTGSEHRNNSKLLDKFYKIKFSDPKQYTAKEIRDIRKRTKLSQPKFARLIRAKLTTYQKWERGAYPPNRYACFILEIIEKRGIEVLLFS